MKICWDNLEGLYLSQRGNLRYKNTTYYECEACKTCGESFLASIKGNVFCCNRCASFGISDETRKSISNKTSGEKNPMYGVSMSRELHWNWQGGKTSERGIFNNSPEYKLWRKAIYERDNYTCQMCRTTKSDCFNAHHIFRWIDYPEFRFEVWNGITLCEECHRKTYGKEKLFIKQFLNITCRT